MVTEPRNPFQRSQLHHLQTLPSPAPVNDLCFVQAIDRLGQRVAVAVISTADRRLDACFGQPFAVADETYCEPRSLCLIKKSRLGSRAYSAFSSALSKNAVSMLLLTRQPTIWWAKTSMTKAT